MNLTEEDTQKYREIFDIFAGSKGYIVKDDVIAILIILKFEYTAAPLTYNDWKGVTDPVESLLFGEIMTWNGTLPDSVIYCNYTAKYNPYSLNQPLTFKSVSNSIEWLNSDISVQELFDCSVSGPKVIKVPCDRNITSYKGFRPIWVDELKSFPYLLWRSQALMDDNEEAALVNGYLGKYAGKFVTEKY